MRAAFHPLAGALSWLWRKGGAELFVDEEAIATGYLHQIVGICKQV